MARNGCRRDATLVACWQINRPYCLTQIMRFMNETKTRSRKEREREERGESGFTSLSLSLRPFCQDFVDCFTSNRNVSMHLELYETYPAFREVIYFGKNHLRLQNTILNLDCVIICSGKRGCNAEPWSERSDLI